MFFQIKFSYLIVLFISMLMASCTSQELKHFGQDIAHNVGCDQQYDHMHRADTLRDSCLNNRP